MKQFVTFTILLITTLLLSGCGDSKPSEEIKEHEKIRNLWLKTITPYTDFNLWEPERIYDAGHVLMVPMEYAFVINQDPLLQQDFHELFNRYDDQFESILENNHLSRFQFYYTVLRYLNYLDSEQWEATHLSLFNKIKKDFLFHWYEREQSNWGVSGKGRVEIIEWKIENKGTSNPMFRRATIDLEYYGFAIAAELFHLSRVHQLEIENKVFEVVKLARQVFELEVEYNSSGWLYHPGQWEDYEHYLYAGHYFAEENLAPSPISGIAIDSSHSHRMPLWLASLQKAFTQNSDGYHYFQTLIDGFKEQFLNIAFVPSNSDFYGPRMTNYIDGNNGLYRYKYHNNPELKLAYEPYNLSGSLFISFYPFMYDERLAKEFAQLSFPLPDETIELYQGLGPTQDTENFISFPNYFHNGFAELYSLIAAKMY